MKFVDVKNDIAFRKIFANENRKEVLISFLNAILDFTGDQAIVDVTLLNPFQIPKFLDGKATIVDVKARDQAGREYIVEMQVAELHGFSKRVLFYASQAYSTQIERGEFYHDLRPVIFIGILEFSLSSDPEYLTRHRIRNVKTGEELFEDFEFNFIELPKFAKSVDQLETLTDKWVFFLKEAENLHVIPENTTDAGLQSAYEEANIRTWEKEELSAYDYASMREQDERSKYQAAEIRGEKRGLKQGIEQGKRNAALETARQMKVDGLPTETIIKYTNLTINEIEEL